MGGCVNLANSNHLKYRAYIDGLRAIAVLAVLFFHADIGCRGGYVGVDVFFVISGYLISGLILKDLDGGQFQVLKLGAPGASHSACRRGRPSRMPRRRLVPVLSAGLPGTRPIGVRTSNAGVQHLFLAGVRLFRERRRSEATPSHLVPLGGGAVLPALSVSVDCIQALLTQVPCPRNPSSLRRLLQP